jgi:YihY family inner membrane protein
MNKSHNNSLTAGRASGFLLRVLRGFMRNQGLLLSGAVAYYTLLSIVPLSILALVVLTQFINEQHLIDTLSIYLELVIPGYAVMLTEQTRTFLENRTVVGIIGFLGLLFFGSTAFSMLENAMAVIFSRRVCMQQRKFFVSAFIPYGYIFVMGLGIVLVSCIVAAIETLESHNVTMFGLSLNPGVATWVALYILGIVGEVLLFTSIYMVMPVVTVRFRHALIGGITAAFLWEITRRVLIWYYAVTTMANVIYGSIAITVIALIIIQVVAIILLLGAQVIAEIEDSPSEEFVDAGIGI